MLQIDASLHPWFGSDYPKATLHGAIDDSTATVMKGSPIHEGIHSG